jgi:hypothetical protein
VKVVIQIASQKRMLLKNKSKLLLGMN